MTKAEMLEKLNAIEALRGLEIIVDKNRPIIEANYFNRTTDWKATKAVLADLGFDCGPNCAIIYTDDPSPKPSDPKPFTPDPRYFSGTRY